jgi:DNA-binding transcriptional MerR regulator
MREEVPDDLLKIGEFAEISDVAAKTLRYYDRIGLFKPVYVDPANDYRYYSPNQLPRITRILTLKDLGLSLEQIARLLEDDLSMSELRGMLRLKRQEHLRHSSGGRRSGRQPLRRRSRTHHRESRTYSAGRPIARRGFPVQRRD